MASRPRRYRSSTSASTQVATTKATEVLQGLLRDLSATLAARPPDGFPDIDTLLDGSRRLHQHIAASHPPSPPQDDFRRLHGFQLVLDVLRSFSGFYNPRKRSTSEKKKLFELLHIILAVISAAFREHPGNRRFFKNRIDGSGWESLEQIIASIGLGGSDSDLWTNCQLFGKLLSFSLDDQRLDDVCQSLAPATEGDKEGEEDSQRQQTSGSYSQSIAKADSQVLVLQHVEDRIRSIVSSKTVVRNAEIFRTVVGFWESIPRSRQGDANPASLVVLVTLSSLASTSFYNLAALHGTGILSRFLRLTFSPESPLNKVESEQLLPLCSALMCLGINELSDAQFLLALQDPAPSEFCLRMTKIYDGPSCIQFDLSLHGHSSIELPSLGRSFPPTSSAGYSFTAWVRVDRFDPNSHTTLFGIFDSTQTCFLLAYLERDTHNFILQTSVTSQRPSVRFKTVTFKENRWYHIAVVHRRPKTMTASKASLYVNGEFAEQIKSQYPSPPPLSNGSTESFASFTSSNNKTNPVQAFLGTPRDLSNQVGPGLVFSKWSLASAHLFEDVLSDDLLAVHFRLGPRYQGNFQDCLGGFQTYEASAALGLRNEVFHPGKDENSDILKAIRDKASTIIPESKILTSTLPKATFRYDGEFVDSLLFRSLSRTSASNLLQLTTKAGSTISINAAVPCINDALVRPNGVGVMAGDPVLALPYNFDDNLWRLGGFTPVALKLVERSSTADELLRSVELMLRCISSSWRNSEAMERDNGYAILSMILRAKVGYGGVSASDNTAWRLTLTVDARDKLSFQLLSLVLDFVGYKHADPIESFIVNPLAYRVLLIDNDTWRKAAPMTQELYYRQFITFAVKSKYHQFNSRRLLRMRIIKRLLDALKGEAILDEIMPRFIESFECLVKSNYNAEVHRSIALFITYTFHTPAGSSSRTPKPMTPHSRSSTPGMLRRPTIEMASSSPSNASKYLTKKQLGIKILEMYTRLLCTQANLVDIRKFAKTVTNKWLLYLLGEDDPEIVVYGCKILARLLVTQPPGYTSKFSSKTGGFWIMAHRLKQWWDIPTLWAILFSVMFGYDVAEINFDKSFDFYSLLEIFGERKVVYPDVLPVMTAMLQHGLRDILKYQDDPDSPANDQGTLKTPQSATEVAWRGRPRARSMELAKELESRQIPLPDRERVASHGTVLQTVVRFLADMHTRSANFRDFALTSDYVRLILWALYPVIVSADPVTAETELNSKDSALTFEGGDVIMRPVPGSASGATPIVRTSNVSASEPPLPSPALRRGTPLRRPSSFILVTSQPVQVPTPTRLAHVMSPKKRVASQQVSNVVLEGLLELVLGVFSDQVLARKEFPGFGLFLKVPPGFQEHQAYFESYILRNTITNIGSIIQLDKRLLTEPKVLQNMARFNLHMVEAIFEGWFLNGADAMLDFTGILLEFLQRPEVATMKAVRLCSSAVSTIRHSFLKLVLLRLSDMDDPQMTDAEASSTMEKLLYWQTVILGSLSTDDDYMRLLWYQLYNKLIDSREPIRLIAATIWRIMLVQKPEESALLFKQFMAPEQAQLTKGFRKLTQLDDATFFDWIDQHRPSLDMSFFGGLSKNWEDFVSAENFRTTETARSRLKNRKEKLKQWHAEAQDKENMLLRHEMANSAWMKSIYFTEHFKHQRLIQDQQDDNVFLISAFAKMERDLRRPGAVFSTPQSIKWKLDRTEGRNRMRLRLLPEYESQQPDYQPKRRATESGSSTPGLKLNTAVSSLSSGQGIGMTPATSLTPPPEMGADGTKDGDMSADPDTAGETSEQQSVAPEDDFELVEDPNDPDADDAFEDKNRKVMRKLEQGDAIQQVYNISRIIGLEACEGILIVGKGALYIMDNVFRSAEGEIINVWQAPPEERDPFSIIIQNSADKTVQGPSDRRQNANRSEQESRHWRWHDVLSLSKRRFLFRDVAIEIFFTDGRSYLLTAMNTSIRDEIHAKLTSKTPHTNGPNSLPNPEDGWRLDALKSHEDSPQTFGSKFGSIFNASPWNPMMRRWQKGEMSNFHYLMLVNTLAGRTFNDLTQYPVFPWVIADYTSEELNLNDPATFRDLSKPMGAQSASRTADFSMRYNSLAEIGETPFHYGTHYSSAMIVSSYLIRLPPFVQSFILLQGGTFDHPDRLFFSIEGAWASCSKENGSDVRELIPEFFYLPEFLTNRNGYNFGVRQGNGGKVDNVILPPWAKGDPKIFIAKQREALESPYVSQHLHKWIDLVFGFKQRGDAAVEALNVFHHLSYRGAKDLDNITDPQERRIITGIIHNFGQTPNQVFTRPHPAREHERCPIKRLDTSIYALTKLPHALLESHERVSSLIYAPRLDRLLCASPFRLNLPPQYDKFLEWGYADNSVRFFFSDNRRPAGLFENLHIGQISALTFADSKTLITAGEDCVVSIYSIHSSPGKPVELVPRSSLFGHKTPVTTIAVSKSLSTFVTVSHDGVAFLWDLNRLEFVRKLPLARPVECARIHDVTGEIMLCSGPNVLLYTLNGEIILDQNVCGAEGHDDFVHSCAFYEGAGNEWVENFLVFTGHKRGRVNVWRKTVGKNGKWILEFLRRLDHVDPKSENGANVEAAITCITPMPQMVYTGDEDGRVVSLRL
ncbi:beach-domain-containing protein [Coniochaeta sp. PMI_546]|nr:beach-domain-containing protein [Coniochaeta sp. PMI_546]